MSGLGVGDWNFLKIFLDSAIKRTYKYNQVFEFEFFVACFK